MFKRKKKTPEQNVIGFHPDGISYVSVNRSEQEKPRISALEFIPEWILDVGLSDEQLNIVIEWSKNEIGEEEG